jgi:hypothetical protein
LVIEADQANQRLGRDHDSSHRGDRAEHREGDRQRPHGLDGVELVDRGEVEHRDAWWCDLGDLASDSLDVGRAVSEHQPLEVVGGVERHRVAEGRGQQQAGGPVRFVLEHLVGEEPDPHQGRDHPARRCGRIREERRVLDLIGGVDAEVESLADVIAVPLGGELVDDQLVDPLRVGGSPLGRGEPVLVEVSAVEGAGGFEVLGEVGPTGAQGIDVEPDVGP